MAHGTHAPILVLEWGTWRVVVERAALPLPHLADLYDRLASTWHQRRGMWGFDAAYEGVLASVRAPAHPRVVDLGTGDGGFAAAWCRVSGRPRHLDLVDVSPRMLDVARSRLAPHADAVDVHRDDVRELSLPAGCADVVLAGHVLEHLADPAPAMAAIRRVLAPDGVAVVVLTRPSPWGRWLQLRWRLTALSDAEVMACAGRADLVATPLAWRRAGWPGRLSRAWRLHRADRPFGRSNRVL